MPAGCMHIRAAQRIKYGLSAWSLICLPAIYSLLFCSKLHERTVTAVMMTAVMGVTDDYSSCKDSDNDVLQYTSQSVRCCFTLPLTVLFYTHKISHKLVACHLFVN
jgi:hypothetical protein